MSKRRRPTHPGAILREDILPELKMTQIRLAEALGVSRRSMNEIINERRPVTTDMAHRLARVFKTTPEFWLHLQQAVDLWDLAEAKRTEYEKLKVLPRIHKAA